MDEVLDISSDSSNANLNEDDPDVAALVNKYISENNTEESLVTRLQFEDNELTNGDFGVPLLKRAKTVTDNTSEASGSSISQNYSKNEVDELRLLQEKYNKINKASTSEDDRVDLKKLKELQKQKKLEEKMKKKEEAEREKILKQALAEANRNCKPTECLRFITVIIDDEIVTSEYGNKVTTTLEAADIKYNIQSQIFPRTITWTRKLQSHLIGDNGELVLSSNEDDTNHVLLVMNSEEFLNHVEQKSLCTQIQLLKSLLSNDKKVALVIYGLQTYERYLKSHHQQELRSQMNENSKANTNNKLKNYPLVSKNAIEFALTELQLLCSCSYRLADSPQDFASVVSQFTKAVSEIPFKLQRHEKFQQTEWFVAGDNRDTVKVDRNGNGLNRLWNQMLTMFPLARLETAEAITAKYPTLSSLMSAYENCASVSQGESLLQEIPIRRAAGPLSASRKVGLELSKRIYNFLTSTDGDILL